jgi:hypothetical protein
MRNCHFLRCGWMKMRFHRIVISVKKSENIENFDLSKSCLEWFLMWAVIYCSQINSNIQFYRKENLSFFAFSQAENTYCLHRNLHEEEWKFWSFIVMFCVVLDVSHHLFFKNKIKISNSNDMRNYHFLRFGWLKMRFFHIENSLKKCENF